MTAAARDRLLPFRDVFAVLFFVAVGSLIDPAAIPASVAWFGLVIVLVLLVKGGTIFAVARRLGLRGVTPWQLGVGLGQIGEFSFVLASLGATRGWITPHVYTAVLAAVVASIAIATTTVRRYSWARAG